MMSAKGIVKARAVTRDGIYTRVEALSAAGEPVRPARVQTHRQLQSYKDAQRPSQQRG